MDFIRPDTAAVFSGSPLDRADEKRADADWIRGKIREKTTRFIAYCGLRPLMRRDPPYAIAYLSFGDIAADIEGGAVWVFLGLKKGRAYFAISLPAADPEHPPLHKAGEFQDVRAIAIQAAGLGKGTEAAMIGQGKSLLDWNTRRKFCSVCGAECEMARAGYLRRCTNGTCAAEHFPRTDPVVIMLALHEGRCLIGRQPKFIEDVYSALAGFMEPGESIEEAVRRELLEEAGIPVGRVSYVESQPWPFPSSLMIGCIAEALSDKIKLDENELEHAFWVEKAAIRDVLGGDRERHGFKLPPKMAIANRLLTAWAFSD